MCDEGIHHRHPHLVNLVRRSLLCVCEGCYAAVAAAVNESRRVEERYLRFPDFAIPELPGEHVPLPAGITLVTRTLMDDRLVACWPTSRGANEVALPPGLWQRMVEANPAIAVAQPHIESLLIRRPGRGDEPAECLLVPTEACSSFLHVLRSPWPHPAARERATHALDELWARADSLARAALTGWSPQLPD